MSIYFNFQIHYYNYKFYTYLENVPPYWCETPELLQRRHLKGHLNRRVNEQIDERTNTVITVYVYTEETVLLWTRNSQQVFTLL